jgi:hypothetical protein
VEHTISTLEKGGEQIDTFRLDRDKTITYYMVILVLVR